MKLRSLVVLVSCSLALLAPTLDATKASAQVGPYISLGGPVLPGYIITIGTGNVDWKQGNVTIEGLGNKTMLDASSPTHPNLFSIPESLKPGTHRLVATQKGRMITEYYAYVGQFNPQAMPSTWWTRVGTTIYFSGEGWKPGETVTLTRNGQPTGRSSRILGGTGLYYDVRGRIDPGPAFSGLASPLSFTVPASLRCSTNDFAITGSQSAKSVHLTVGVAC